MAGIDGGPFAESWLTDHDRSQAVLLVELSRQMSTKSAADQQIAVPHHQRVLSRYTACKRRVYSKAC